MVQGCHVTASHLIAASDNFEDARSNVSHEPFILAMSSTPLTDTASIVGSSYHYTIICKYTVHKNTPKTAVFLLNITNKIYITI